MSRHRGLGSVFWALILISLGTVLLLRNLGYSLPIWQGLARYWPLLIIGWGLLKVVDYYRLKGETRSLFSGGEVALLIFVLFVGSAFTAAAHISSDLGFLDINLGENFDLFDILGENFEFDARLELEAEAGGIVEIHNVYGDVEVSAGGTDGIVVEIVKTVRARDRAEAERIEPELSFTIVERDGTYLIESNRDDIASRRRRRFKTSLAVKVPALSAVTVDNRYGTVTISGLTGDMVVVNRYGGTTIEAITGAVRIEDGYGPLVVEDIIGDVDLLNRYGSVTVSGVTGQARVENKYGTIRVSQVDGDATIVNKYSTVSLEEIGGRAEVEGRNNSVDVENVRGAVDVKTSYKDIVVRNPGGPVELANRHGDIRVSFDTPPEHDVSLTGDYSDLQIELPAVSSFVLDALTRSGSFDSDFEGIKRTFSGRTERAEGEQGQDGPRLALQTGRGDVRLFSRN